MSKYKGPFLAHALEQSIYFIETSMKLASFVPILLPLIHVAALAAEGCPNSYIRRSDSVQKQSVLYLIQVPKGFSPSRADIKATYNSIGSSQSPTYQCVFNPPFYGNGYKSGVCKNLSTGRLSSIYGGTGYRIESDGNTVLDSGCYGYGSACAYLEDANRNRIAIDNDIANNLDYADYIINDCSTGAIEALSFREAFPGYIILERAVEKGFVNTYNSAPDFRF